VNLNTSAPHRILAATSLPTRLPNPFLSVRGPSGFYRRFRGTIVKIADRYASKTIAFVIDPGEWSRDDGGRNPLREGLL
jgi:hypothetical protein